MKNELEISGLGLLSILLTFKVLILIPIIISISGLPAIIMVDLNKEHRTKCMRKPVPKLSINEFVDAKYKKIKKYTLIRFCY